ncbi:hypothetical protein [Ruegeria atlantica]|uniref:hypothetical protein n=1 Tax=Ruegeria atlantica TaxID=81569 RepID=UPI0014815A1E|nr:hypothetical protein [Ruegeria atlantica]
MTKEIAPTTLSNSARRVWKSAQMYISFHKDRNGKDRKAPKLWPPENGSASIHPDPKSQEATIHVKAIDPKTADDLEIKMHPSRVVVRRDTKKWWQGVAIEDDTIRVRMADGTYITIEYDGRIKRYGHEDNTYVEADGSIFKHTAFAESYMAADGVEISRRTEDRIASITADGVVDRSRNR